MMMARSHFSSSQQWYIAPLFANSMKQKLNRSSRRLLAACSLLLVRLILVDRAMFLSEGGYNKTQHHSSDHSYHLLNQPVPSGLDQIYNRSISLVSESTNSTSRVVSLAFANANYLEQHLLQNLVCSFHRSQVTNWVVVAMDEKAVKLARNANITHVHFDKTYWKGVKSGRLRKRTRVTNDYTRMIQLRTNFIRTLLYTYDDLDIVTSDGDTTWTTRPWETIPFGRDDTNCSVFLGNANELGTSETEVKRFRPSCGFLMLHNCEATRRLYDAWLEKEVSGGEKEQATLTKVLRQFPHNLTIQPSKWMNQSHPPGKPRQSSFVLFGSR